MNISKEAIETVAAEICDWDNQYAWKSLGAESPMKASYEDAAERALTAAAPFIQAAELRDAAEVFATGEWADAFMAGNVTDDVSAVKATDKWLTDRADRLEGKTK